MGTFLSRSLGRCASAVAMELARTPGAWLVRLEWEFGISLSRGPRPKPVAFSIESIPEALEAPEHAVGFRVTVSGAFEPTRPTDTDAEMQTELTRLRRLNGMGGFPAGTVVQRVGLDDLGFFAYQLTLAQSAGEPLAVPTDRLCAAG